MTTCDALVRPMAPTRARVRRMLSISMSMFLHGAIALAATIASPSRNKFANRSVALASSRSNSARVTGKVSTPAASELAADGGAHEAGGADDDHATRFDAALARGGAASSFLVSGLARRAERVMVEAGFLRRLRREHANRDRATMRPRMFRATAALSAPGIAATESGSSAPRRRPEWRADRRRPRRGHAALHRR